MHDLIDHKKAPHFDITKASETLAKKRMDEIAREAADKAQKTEQHYDRDHNIFTK